ncbi:DUF362 domain-containing protein [Halothermothrix orenii]|uniref:Ferredoxin n=1 Tax=Halothermothrix orenii (strain H 168 / OCM 544 / DSM 9562) TaxID=373903 RepID=B8D1J2_HALOH|nr:DUF362 domain-containing protein [Halothermothrix orenii]ACL69069.1 uncharacterized conserved protein [Halothermothrix orenii H 168]
MERVSVIKCDSYKGVEEKVVSAVKLLGGIEKFVKPGQKVLLKVNLLMGKPPDKAITTHPRVVKAVGELVKQAGGQVIIGDSPGGPFTKNALRKIYRVTGMEEVAEELGAELNYDVEQEKVEYRSGIITKSFIVGKYITGADVIINIPKLKTHGMTMYTGAVKNLYGAIPGLLKADYHLRMPELSHFSQMLIDLAFCVKPALNIMDGIIGMEGDGPSGGTPRKFGYILASASPLGLDVAALFLMGVRPLNKVPLIKAARERGEVADITDINLVGDKLYPLDDVEIPQGDRVSNLLDKRLPGPLANILGYLLRPRPVFDHGRCTGCQVCFKHCPAKTIEMVAGKPEVNLNNCIRCFCCQELCPYNAVDIKRPLLGRLIF